MASAIVGALKVILSADTAEYRSAMQQAGKEAAAMSRDFGNIGRQMTAVGSALTKTLTLPILAVGVGAVKAAADFESSFANVAKTVDGVADSSGTLTAEGQALAKTFREMAKEIPATTEELTAIAALGGQMGVPIGQLEDFTRNVAALSVAVDGISAEEAAAGLAQIGNIFGKGTAEISQMSSALVHLGNSSNATEGDILEFSKRLAGAANAVNMTEAETMALGTAMANVGINAEAGGTAMSTMIAKMSMAVSKGGDALNAFGKVSGLGAKGFAEAWKGSPIQAIDAVVQGLARTKAEGGDLNLVVREIGATNIRTADTMKRLAGAGDGVAQMLAVANEGYQSSNKHLEEAAKKYATFNNQLKVLWNQVKDVGIELGNSLLPAMKSLVSVAQDLVPVLDMMVKAFTAMPGWVQGGAVALLGLVAAAGPVLWVVGQITTAIGTVIGAFKAKGIAMRAMTALMGSTSVAAGMLRTALAFLGPVAAVVSTAFASLSLGKWIGEVTGLTNVVGYLSTKLGEFIGLLPKGAAAQYTAMIRAKEAADAAKEQTAALTGTETALKDVTGAAAVAARGQQALGVQMEQSEGDAKAAKKAAEDFAESLKKLGGRDALAGAEDVVKQLHAMGGPLNVLPSKLQEMAARMREGAEAAIVAGRSGLADQYMKLADTLDPVIQFQQRYNVTIGEYVTMAPQAVTWTEELNEQLHRLGGTVQTIGPVLTSGLDLAKMFEPLKAGVKSAMPDTNAWAEAWSDMKGGLSQTLSDIPQILANAFTGGGDIMGAVKAIVSQIGSTIGGAIGGAFGGPAGQKIGAALGSMTGLLVEPLKKLFGIGVNDEVKKANVEIGKLVDGILKLHGPIDVTEQKFNAVGLSLKDNLGHQGQAGLAAMNELIAEFNRRWEESEATLKGLNGDLTGLLDKARGMGYEFDASGKFVSVTFDALQQKAKDFGVDINSLGPAFRQQAMDAEAVKVIDAFTLMSKAGGDVGGILAGMKDEIGKIVGDSLKFGTTVPANMQPWIEELIRTNQLTDENGVAITDLTAIKFGAPIATQFETIQASIMTLVDRIGELIAAISAIPTSRTLTLTTIHENVYTGEEPSFPEPRGDDGGFKVGTMGRLGQWFGNFGDATRTALHGIEAVVTPAQAPAFAMDVLAGLGGGGVSSTVSMVGIESRLDALTEHMQRRDRSLPSLIASAVNAKAQLGRRRS